MFIYIYKAEKNERYESISKTYIPIENDQLLLVVIIVPGNKNVEYVNVSCQRN